MPTSNPVPSQDPSDLLFNAQKLDQVVNSVSATYVDRFGVRRLTLAGADAAMRDAINAAMQYNMRGAWSTGTAYAWKDVFSSDGVTYVALSSHTGTSIAADLASGKIGVFSGNAKAISYDGEYVEQVLDNAKSMQGYTALRNYTGRATGVRITSRGVSGYFQREDFDTVSLDDNGVTIVDALSRRWKRLFSGAVNVLWFGAVADGNLTTAAGTDNSPMFQAACDYCQVANLALHAPAGFYVLRSKIFVSRPGPNGIHFSGDGMYRTVLIAPTSFTENGLLRGDAGGPPTVVRDMAILGQVAGGAGAGSTGLLMAGNAILAHNVWIGGFSTQFGIEGTDCWCFDCWSDVSLASGTGFFIKNGGNSLLGCTSFNTYTGILVYGGDYWLNNEPDIGVKISNFSAIQCGYSGLTITNRARNVEVSTMMLHSPVANEKFTRDFITIDDGCENIILNQVHGNFGAVKSSSTIGIAVNGQPSNISITNSSMKGCLIGSDIDQPLGLVVTGSQFHSNKLGGLRVRGYGAGAVSITGNSAMFNGDSNSFAANQSFGFSLYHGASAAGWTVSGNTAFDFAGLQYYGFYVEHTGNSRKLAFTGNASVSDGVKFSYNGTGVANIINQSTNAS